MIVIGYIGEDEELVKRKYEDPFAEPAPVPDAEPATSEPALPVPVPA